MDWFKACEKTFNITPLKVIEVQQEYLIVESKLGFDGKSKLMRYGVNYACYDSWQAAHRYLMSYSQAKLDELRKNLGELIESHSKIEKLINPYSPEAKLLIPQIA